MLTLIFFAALSAPAPAAPPLLATSQEKLDLIRADFLAEAPAAKHWFWAWTAGFLALTTVQGAFAVSAAQSGNNALRNSQAVGAAVDAVGLIAHVAIPFGAAFSLEDFDDFSGADKLSWAEKRLEEDAGQVHLNRSWVPHVVGPVLGLASGLTLWLGFHQLSDGIVSFLSVVAVSELRVWTMPTLAAHDAQDYKARIRAPQISLLAFPGGAGLKMIW